MHNLRIGFFLGLRKIQHANPWTNILIISVVIFTFINLVAVSGILTGIVDGALRAVKSEILGDIIINELPSESRILETEYLLRELATYDSIESFTPHYEDFATIEANYQERRDPSAERDTISVNILGINPAMEDATLALKSTVTEGEPLEAGDRDYIIIGKYYIDRHAKTYGDVFESLSNVYPGDVVRLTAGTQTKEFTVKGIIHSKMDIPALSVYITDIDFRRLFNRIDNNANKIIIRVKSDHDPGLVLQQLINTEMDQYGEIKSYEESIPKFIKDTAKTFDTLGIFIGGIGLVVASITVFIIIFINILANKRQIGILKAIGIKRKAIQYAYATQSAFYALIGTILGVIIVLGLLVPYFEANPIDFPYSDVILSTNTGEILSRCVLLFITMIIAGMLPAWTIVRQNTLNTILGRK